MTFFLHCQRRHPELLKIPTYLRFLGHLAPAHRCACTVCSCCSVCGVLGHLAPVHRCARSVCCVACALSWATWLLFTGVPARCVVVLVWCPWPLGSCSPVCLLAVLCCVCGALGPLAPVHRCAGSVPCVACAVSFATWLLFTGVPARCVVLHVPCPGPLGSCALVCALGALCCVCRVLGHLAPVQGCARSVHCVVCAVSWAIWLLFTGVPARCVVLRVRCASPLSSCSPACPLGALCCMCRVLGHLAPVHLCARSVRCVACAVSWATWLLCTGVPARCIAFRVRVLGHLAPVHRCARLVRCVACAVSWATWLLCSGAPAPFIVLCVRCPGPLDSCSPVCPLGALWFLCGVLGHLAPVHWCARSLCCVACAVPCAPWLPFTGVLARCLVLRVRCPLPLASCSPACPLGALCCMCRVLGHLAPVHWCARSVRCVACAVSWATWLLCTGVTAPCIVLCLRCPGSLGSCSPVCPLGALCCVCGVLGHSAPLHRFARSVRCVPCTVSWATRLLFTGVCARCVVLRLPCPGPLGSCSPVCPLGASCFVFGVLGHLAPVHRCAGSVPCVACAVSFATWLLFTGVPAWCVVLHVPCPGPLGSCALVCPLGALCCVCRVLGHLASVQGCARSVHCVVCAVSWATWLLFTGVPARCVVVLVWCPGPLGSCSPVRPVALLCCVCGALGPLAPVHRCAGSVPCVARAVSFATWLLSTGVPARCVVLHVPCPGPLGSCALVCALGALCCLCRVLGHLAPVHGCARSVHCVVCAMSWITWVLFTGMPAWCVVLRVRCPGPLGSCSPVCSFGALRSVYSVLGHEASVHRYARSVCCAACTVSWATWLLWTVCILGMLCCVCGVLGHLAPVRPCVRSVCGVACAVPRAHTRPSGRRLFHVTGDWSPFCLSPTVLTLWCTWISSTACPSLVVMTVVWLSLVV